MADNDKKITLEVDESFINKIFELTDKVPPSLKDVNLTVLKKQLYDAGIYFKKISDKNEEMALQLKRAGRKVDTSDVEIGSSETIEEEAKEQGTLELSDFACSVSNVQKASEMAQLGISMNYSQSTLQFIDPENIQREKHQFYDADGHPVKGKVLIIDDLGIITYQLSAIFKRAGYLPITAKEISEAIEKYKRSLYDFVLVDLFIPTEREGFILLDELKKIAASRNETPLIAVMSASTKVDFKQKCQNKGVAFYIEKVDDWQKELFGMLLQYN